MRSLLIALERLPIAGGGLAEAAPGRRMSEPTLTESQKQQLFQARRNWLLRS